MIVEINKSFEKNFEQVKDKTLAKFILEAINNVEADQTISDIIQIKKLVGTKNAYRIKKGNYRIGVTIQGKVVEFIVFAHRKDIYKQFP